MSDQGLGFGFNQESSETELANARSIVEKMLRLFENEDYKLLHTMMQDNLDNQVRSLLNPPLGLDGVVKLIHTQGRIAGFQEAMSYASMLHDGAMGTIAQLSYLDKKEEENG